MTTPTTLPDDETLRQWLTHGDYRDVFAWGDMLMDPQSFDAALLDAYLARGEEIARLRGDDPATTHHPECWRHHLGCAVEEIARKDARIAELEREIAGWKAFKEDFRI